MLFNFRHHISNKKIFFLNFFFFWGGLDLIGKIPNFLEPFPVNFMLSFAKDFSMILVRSLHQEVTWYNGALCAYLIGIRISLENKYF